ncbi:hypothetical protein CJ030_MR1G020552 [Morella rubra]|uniref:Uncharacterized protein n=1 Tax=Morella rubra TaxID=262757 RepID=A0A6A1WM02_9ROSI|nr:hypothetical protein CJ030_MR1G020552 [Morella rubra]
MLKRQHSATMSSSPENFEQQTLESLDGYMTLEEQRPETLTRAIIVECEVSFHDSLETRFEGRSIGDIIDDKGWIGFLKKIGSTSVDIVWEFDVALLDVVDIDTPV